MGISPGKLRFLGYRRRSAYQRVFEDTEEGREVLADLMEHCGWSKDLFHENPTTMSNLVGRRHAVLHIKSILNMTDEQLDLIAKAQTKRYEAFDDD